MKITIFSVPAKVVFVLAILWAGIPCMASVRIVIYPTDDAFVCSWQPSQNYGLNEKLYTRNGSGLEYRTYLKFDLSRIPDDKNIISARLALYCNRNYGGIVYVHYLEDNNWQESTITWNNAPASFQSIATDSLDPNINYNYWTVTGDVADAHSEDDIYSVVVKMASGSFDQYNYFYSKDFWASDSWPFLEVTCDGDRYGGGSGTAEKPYLIYTAEQLSWIGDNHDDWDKHFRLMADVDLSAYTGVQFHIISTDWQEPFTGNFDGNRHVISNFTFEADPNVFFNYVGLFGCVDQEGTVKNLGLESPHIFCGSSNGAGSLTGDLSGGTIENCWARNVQVSGDFRVGGLIGQLYDGMVYNSFVDGGVVSVKNNYCGGLVGENDDTILRCYSTCAVTGPGSYQGGLVGYNPQGFWNSLDSFWDTEASGQAFSCGGTGKTTAQMKTQSTFTIAGWDFVGETINGTADIWRLCTDGTHYPRLNWEHYSIGDFKCPDSIEFKDYAVLAKAWMTSPGSANWNPLCDISDPNDDVINNLDLAVFCDYWLME